MRRGSTVAMAPRRAVREVREEAAGRPQAEPASEQDSSAGSGDSGWLCQKKLGTVFKTMTATMYSELRTRFSVPPNPEAILAGRFLEVGQSGAEPHRHGRETDAQDKAGGLVNEHDGRRVGRDPNITSLISTRTAQVGTAPTQANQNFPRG